MSKTEYIPALEGMRSLAVLAVLLFHLETDFVAGGFLGVDLFFIISGFIITRNLLFDMDQQRFSLKDFYYRRFRRIVPALVTTIFFTLLFAILIVPPAELALSAKSAVFSLLSVGNINFWLESGYFDSSAHTKPLLHTWSLSVEEQFYILWPSLLLLASSLRGRVLCTFALLAVSVVLSSYYENVIPEGVFFLLPFRVHQFMAGAIIAVLALRMVGVMGNLVTLAGTLGLIWGFSTITGETPPFSSAIWVTGFGFLLILGRESRAAIILYGNSAMQWLGARSYAIYLVHWPIIVLFKYTSGFELTTPQSGALGIGSIVIAAALHTLVEKPFRKSGPDNSRLKRNAGKLTLGFAIVTLLLASILWAESDFGSRKNRDLHGIDLVGSGGALQRRAAIRMDKCHLERHSAITDFDVEQCATPIEGKYNALVLGDSMAADIYMMLSETYPDMYIGQATAAGCQPLLKINEKKYDTCHDFNKLRLNSLVRRDYDLVVLAGLWTEKQIPQLQETVLFLHSIGIDVLVFGPRIKFPESVRLLIAQEDSLENISEKLSPKADRQESLSTAIIEALPGTPVVDMGKLQCTPICEVVDNRLLLYDDGYHFTLAGARFFGQRFRTLFELENAQGRTLGTPGQTAIPEG
ncbi:MAG: acyltransferase [Halioglobus sp.]|nr:acyltransferase [Halioglobus sp.]